MRAAVVGALQTSRTQRRASATDTEWALEEMQNPLVVTLAASAIFAGCATTENYEKILDNWIGEHVDDLVLSWGSPQATHELPSGNKIVEYHDRRIVFVPGSYTMPALPPPQNYTFSCKTRFVIDQSGVVTKWDWEGDDCIAEPPN